MMDVLKEDTSMDVDDDQELAVEKGNTAEQRGNHTGGSPSAALGLPEMRVFVEEAPNRAAHPMIPPVGRGEVGTPEICGWWRQLR